jgi:hypothetical protein
MYRRAVSPDTLPAQVRPRVPVAGSRLVVTALPNPHSGSSLQPHQPSCNARRPYVHVL